MLKSPYPYFGGKSRVAPAVWARLGADVRNYVEPFFGSGACLLARPDWSPDAPYTETVNDLDGYVANFWRALQAEPDAVARHADWPVNENDLHARHAWLVERKADIVSRLEGDPDWYDAKLAGWWVWGISCWIGSGFCSGKGPWHRAQNDAGEWQLVHLGDKGRGVMRQKVHLGDKGQGVMRQKVHLGTAVQGVKGATGLHAWIESLAERMKRVRVCCGDWSRVCGYSVTTYHGVTGVFLDPPYSAEAGRDPDLYANESATVAHDVRGWAIANGDDPKFRIALCGYDTEHVMPDGWEAYAWTARGGYGSQSNKEGRDNRHREVIWFSPHCLGGATKEQPALLAVES